MARSCLVFSYDPTLFNIVGKNSVQYYYIYNQSFMTFVVALLLSKKFKVAIFSEFIMALTPVLLVWAYPTTSDMPMLENLYLSSSSSTTRFCCKCTSSQ